MNISRNFDIVTGNDDLELLFTIKEFPVFMGTTHNYMYMDKIQDMNFYISRSSGMVQINPIIPPDILYHEDHAPGVVGKIWQDHHDVFGQFIYKYSPKKVIEIGGGNGLLANKYVAEHRIPWTIVDPLSVPNSGIDIINKFFDETIVIDDTVVHSHVLEHIIDPAKFFRILSNTPIGTKMLFSVPAIGNGIKNKYTNAMMFEHTYFCIDEYIRYWLSDNGFKLIETYDFLDHSIFYSAIRDDDVVAYDLINLYDVNKKLFNEFIVHHRTNIEYLNREIQNHNGPVFLFGAHSFSQFLIAMGLDCSKIYSILDNNKDKQTMRLYGTNLVVDDPSVLLTYINPLIILQAGPYTEEIRRGLMEADCPTIRILT